VNVKETDQQEPDEMNKEVNSKDGDAYGSERLFIFEEEELVERCC